TACAFRSGVQREPLDPTVAPAIAAAAAPSPPRPAAAPFPRRLPVGAEVAPDGSGVHFRVWAPDRRRVEVVPATLGGANGGSSGSGGDAGSGNGDGAAATTAARPPWAPLELARETDGGYFAGFVPGAAAGDLYSFRLDGAAERPDPASRRQPAGPHGP